METVLCILGYGMKINFYQIIKAHILKLNLDINRTHSCNYLSNSIKKIQTFKERKKEIKEERMKKRNLRDHI